MDVVSAIPSISVVIFDCHNRWSIIALVVRCVVVPYGPIVELLRIGDVVLFDKR